MNAAILKWDRELAGRIVAEVTLEILTRTRSLGCGIGTPCLLSKRTLGDPSLPGGN
jgi:hypothetical protein